MSERGAIVGARIGAFACSLIVAGAFDGRAYAQEQEEQTPQSSLEQITVTGTRIRRDDFTSPTPTTVIDSDFLQNLGIVNAGDAMKQMPQNVNTNSPTSTPGSNFFNGSNLTNLRGLNPFFGSRSLTLVDTRRHVPTSQGDSVDLNFIPTIMIDRMEVVTGGASASYGSGAISGVTNILLDRDLEGIRGEIDFGTTDEGDGDDLHFGFAFGTGIGAKGHLVVGVEDQDADNIQGCAATRDWCARNYSTIQNPNFPDGANPQFVRRDGIRQSWNSHNGIFYIPRFNGRVPNTQTIVPLEVTNDGTGLQNYDTGLWADGPGGGNPNRGTAIGGSGEGVFDDTGLRTSVERTAAYLAFTYDLTRRLGFFFDASGGSVDAFSPQYFVETNGFCMAPDYAYLVQNPAAQALFANPANRNCRTFGAPPTVVGNNGILTKKNWENQLNTANLSTTDLARYAAGFDGQFGDSSWTWDAYYQYGESDRVQNVYDVLAGARHRLAFDAVLVNGQPVCRGGTTLLFGYPAAAQAILLSGCTPLNIFGQAPLTAAQKNYAFGYLRENTTVEQEIIEATVSGDIAAGFGAGPIKVAVGLSDRTESIANLGAEELGDVLRRDIGIQYGDSFSGKVDVVELFAELDLPIHERFGLNLAARKSEYDNTAGAATGVEGQTFAYDIDTWKVTGNWDVIETLRIRFSRSRDVRAPNFRDLYYRIVTPQGVFFCSSATQTQPWVAPGSLDPCSFDARGGLELRPEGADTTTFGFVIAPPGADLQFAVDLYEIELSEAITGADATLVVANCRDGDQQSCSQITGVTRPFFDPANTIPCPATCFSDIDTIISKAFNLRSYEFTGADFSADWVKTLPMGSLSLRFVATRTFHQKIRGTNNQNPTSVEDIAGATGVPTGILSDWASAPDLTANLTASFRRDNFTITGQGRYVADGVNNRSQRAPGDPGYDITAPPPQSVNVNRVPSHTIYSLSGTYDFDLRSGNTLQFWGSVNNLFDKDPPLVGGGVGGTDQVFFDTLGRTYRVGLRTSF